MSSTSTDAVNGSQLYKVGTALNANIGALGTNLATAQGGSAAYDTTSSAWTAPSYSVANIGSGGTVGTANTDTNVGAAIAGLSTDVTNLAGAVSSGGSIRPFSTPIPRSPNSSATGTNGVAIGGGGTNAATVVASGAGATAIGGNATSSMVAASDSIAIGGQSSSRRGGGSGIAIGLGANLSSARR